MFKRLSGNCGKDNVTITVRQTSQNTPFYFVVPPGSNIIHTRDNVNSAIKLAYTYVKTANAHTPEIFVRDDQNAWPKNYPPLR